MVRRGRLSGMRLTWLASVVLLAGCTTVVPTGTRDGAPAATPHDATAAFRPASMVADRETAAPGEIVELSFPGEMVRGIMYVLEEETGASWIYRYILLSGGTNPTWHRPGDESVAIPDIGAAGVGPDRVVIPDEAPPGTYRICTGNARQNVCVRIEIVEP
jgi:hypothetical protein